MSNLSLHLMLEQTIYFEMNNEENLSEKEKNAELSIENEVLKVKMQLQFGDDFLMNADPSIPPEIENQFLKQVMAFEAMHAQQQEQISVYEKIGKPTFKKISELKTDEISKSLENLMVLMEKHNINLDMCDGPYDDAVIYQFITEELFEVEVEKEFIPGMTCNFIYEEFHLNDKAEITKNTHEFLKHWFKQDFNEYSSELAYTMVTAEGKMLSREAFFAKTKHFFDAFEAFQNDAYNIDEVSFELHNVGKGMGFAEGMLKYDAVLENGEVIHFEGPYKLYMQRGDNW